MRMQRGTIPDFQCFIELAKARDRSICGIRLLAGRH